jgi:hypothetical protein
MDSGYSKPERDFARAGTIHDSRKHGKERKLRVSGNRVLRKVFGTMREEVIGWMDESVERGDS